jgi:hypothetical protein
MTRLEMGGLDSTKGSFGFLIARVFALLLSAVYLRYGLDVFGAPRLGSLLVLISVFNLVSMFDLGRASFILSIPEEYRMGVINSQKFRSLLKIHLLGMSRISMMTATLGLVVLHFDLVSIDGFSDASIFVKAAVFVCFLLGAISTFLFKSSLLLLKKQRYQIILILQQFIPFYSTFLASKFSPSSTVLFLTYASVFIVIQSVNTLAVLRFIRFWRKNEIDSSESSYLEYDHRRFGLLQILNLFVSQIDLILINAFLGSSDVAFYSTFIKIFQIPYLVYSSVLSIYTTSFSTFIAANEKKRIASLLLSIYRYASLVVIPSLIFLIFSQGFLVAFLSNGLFYFSNIQVVIGLLMVIFSFLDYPLAVLRSSIVPSRSYFMIVIFASLTNLLASVMLMIVWKNPVAIIIPNILTIALVNIPANLILLQFLIGRKP